MTTIAKSQHIWCLYTGQGVSLRTRYPPAMLAQTETNVKRAEVQNWCHLRLANGKSSTLQENNLDVAFTHESHHPRQKERTQRRGVESCLNELEIRQVLRASPASGCCCCCSWLYTFLGREDFDVKKCNEVCVAHPPPAARCVWVTERPLWISLLTAVQNAARHERTRLQGQETAQE